MTDCLSSRQTACTTPDEPARRLRPRSASGPVHQTGQIRDADREHHRILGIVEVAHAQPEAQAVLQHADVHVGEHIRVFGQFKSANSTDRDLQGGARTLDVDTAALQQAFADLGSTGKSIAR